jgi:DNA topoisomerase-1
VLPTEPVVYRQKANAQAAHEAIHPTAVDIALPEDLDSDELRLYDLIRCRFLASQCRPAVVAETVALIAAGSVAFRATGSVVTFVGYLHYLDGDEEDDGREEPARLPPLLRVGSIPDLEDSVVEKKNTAPRPRFTRATLIKEMERQGIGRPSTYVSAVAVLFDRDYLGESNEQVLPTSRGRVIDRALARAFPDLGAASNTAHMEAQLDRVGEGKLAWKSALGTWYRPFALRLATAAELFAADAVRPDVRVALPEAPRATDKACPCCQRPLMLRRGRKGAFLACTGYPACDYASDPSAKPSSLPCPCCQGPMEEVAGKFGAYARCLVRTCAGRVDLAAAAAETCPTCQAPMRDRGTFLSCSRYPECKGTRSKAIAAGKGDRACPKCGAGLRKRQGPQGPFWGCSAYPKCRHTVVVTAERRRSTRSKAS